MRRPLWVILILACGLCSLAFASSEGGDDLERNRRLLEKWKADPEHYQRLKRDLAAFYALPPERQEQLRDVDRQLHDADPATQARLWAVLERYVIWLAQRPEAERKAIEEAGDRTAVVRGLRQREWLERLPRPEALAQGARRLACAQRRALVPRVDERQRVSRLRRNA